MLVLKSVLVSGMCVSTVMVLKELKKVKEKGGEEYYTKEKGKGECTRETIMRRSYKIPVKVKRVN